MVEFLTRELCMSKEIDPVTHGAQVPSFLRKNTTFIQILFPKTAGKNKENLSCEW